MPLTVNHKKESKSIEDLIAQLDPPKPVDPPANFIQSTSLPNGDLSNGERKLLKGKRTNSGLQNNNSNHSSSNGNQAILNKNIIVSKKYSKNLKGRGLPKKGGSGGKHTWGAPGCELGAKGYLDKNDPNYDSEDGDNLVMRCVENGTDSDGILESTNLQKLEIDDFDHEIKLVILEYFHNGDPIEVIDHLKCYNFKRCKANLLVYVIQLALEQNDTCKELVSRLLRDFNYELFDSNDFERAFEIIFKNINDIILDNPYATKIIGTFIARCIADNILNKDYLLNYPDELRTERVDEILNEATVLANMNDHLFHLAHIWGHNQGGFTAVKALTDKINMIIQEYNDSGDVQEVLKCLQDLNVPHFNHEFVYEAIDFVLQKGDDNAIEKFTILLKVLCDSVIITYDQLKMGFMRTFDLLSDICLDVPCAYSIIEKILNSCYSKSIIHNDILDLAPNKSRKRMISEGDGITRFKDNILTC